MIYIMKDYEYVQKFGDGPLTNDHAISSLNMAVTPYVHTKPEKSLAGTHASLAQGQAKVEATVARTEALLATDIAALIQAFNNITAHVSRSIPFATSSTQNDNHNVNMEIN